MRRYSTRLLLLLCFALPVAVAAVASVAAGQALAQSSAAHPESSASTVPLALSDAVVATPSPSPLTDPRIFNAEFYRKLNPTLNLATDADALAQWTNSAANHCLRASFNFSPTEYIQRYPDLKLGAATPSTCNAAITQFVTYGFNQGRIGAYDSYPIVFDFNYYVDPANNPDLNTLFTNGTWDAADIEIHWMQHGMYERRNASAFFSVADYQSRYPDTANLTPPGAIDEYVSTGQSSRRMGKAFWADPADWNALVEKTQASVVTAAPNDLVREFTAANGKQTTVIVKSPTWFVSPTEPVPAGIHVCNVPKPSGDTDWATLTQYLTPSGVKSGCNVVRLAPNATYHLVLPQKQPPASDYVLNHWPYLQINNVQDFVFDGNGSTLSFTGPTTGIDINNSQRVVIENLTIDWGGTEDVDALWRGPLFAAIGTIVPDGDTSAHIELDSSTPVPYGFSPYIYAFNLWDRTTNQVADDDYLNTGPSDQGCDIYCLQSGGTQNPSQQSMSYKNGSLYPKSTAAGQWVAAQLIQFPNRTVMVRFQQFAAVAIQDDYFSTDLRVINTTIHTSPYMGITAGQGGRGLSLENITESPSHNRPISTIADGSHFTGVGGDIVVENSNFEREGDDVMNITEVWDTVTTTNSESSFVMAGGDSAPVAGDTIAFFDESFGFLGSSTVTSTAPPNPLPYNASPITVNLAASLPYMRVGLHAINMNHAPSRVYVSNVNIHDKMGRGMLIGGFHMLVQKSNFENLGSSAIAAILSSYFSESTGTSDLAIRDNTMINTTLLPREYQISADATNTYPNTNAAIAMFEDFSSNYDGVSNDVTGIYPLFQNIEISGNTIASTSGPGIFLTGTRDVTISSNLFNGCAVVPNADPIYSYYGSGSPSAVVLSFADTASLAGNHTTSSAAGSTACTARRDPASTRAVALTSP